ncbi:MAG: hypothetical protein M1822_004794 [Bathelium mastoideum]|nr:MAG: hypothetical protein M1822_004794 [Bathelium mastoideum]
MDVGVGFGQDLRQLRHDAAAGAKRSGKPKATTVSVHEANEGRKTRFYAVDARPELWWLGLELFRDALHPPAELILADMTNRWSKMTDSPFHKVLGRVDVYILCQVLDLFDWERQKSVLQTIFHTSKVGSVIVGHCEGTTWEGTRESALDGKTLSFIHSKEWFWRMFTDAQSPSERETKWKLEIETCELERYGIEKDDVDWMERRPSSVLTFYAVREI